MQHIDANFKKLIETENDDINRLIDEIFYNFYDLEISDSQLNGLEVEFLKLDTTTKVLSCAEKLSEYLKDFIKTISTTNELDEIETLKICQTRSGLQCFINVFSSCFKYSKYLKAWTRKNRYIIELDEEIRNWKIFYYCLDNSKIDSYFPSSESKKDTHYWWFSPL